jgi:flagellar motility protein MotE (MotC chaperone)
MDTNGLTKSEKQTKFQLVKEISPSEASDVIMSLIDEKLIFIKNKLQNWEQNHKSNSDEIDERINQLEKKKAVKDFITDARNQKSNLNKWDS